MVEHHLQRQILERLSFADSLRFSELKPDDIENNSFNYHLRQLISLGLVSKVDDGYQLTDSGLAYVDKLSHKLHRQRQQPKLIVLIALSNGSGKWLLAEHKVQPYIGRVGFISGKQHFGEAPDNHLKRELTEQLGADLQLVARGLVDIRSSAVHIVGQVYSGHYDGPLPAETVKFSYRWSTLDADTDTTPGTRQIASLLSSSEGFFQLSLDL